MRGASRWAAADLASGEGSAVAPGPWLLTHPCMLHAWQHRALNIISLLLYGQPQGRRGYIMPLLRHRSSVRTCISCSVHWCMPCDACPEAAQRSPQAPFALMRAVQDRGTPCRNAAWLHSAGGQGCTAPSPQDGGGAELWGQWFVVCVSSAGP